MRMLRSLFIVLAVIIAVALLSSCSVFDRQHSTVHDHQNVADDHLGANHDRHAAAASHHSHEGLTDTTDHLGSSAHHIPQHYRATVDHDQIALTDMYGRAAHHLPQSIVLPETFGSAERWSRDWELRWVDYQTSAGIVRVYHATNRNDDHLRFTSQWGRHEARNNVWELVRREH
jgi:hypothetical protein